MVFDLVLLSSTILTEDDFEAPVFVLALVIIAVSLVQNLSILFLDILEIFKKWCSNNKVSDISQEKLIKDIQLQNKNKKRHNIFKETDQ